MTGSVNRNRATKISQSAVMCGGFALLMTEIRFEHRGLLIDDGRGWIPIVFCVTMLLAIPIATSLWQRGGQKALLGIYFLTACLGMLGVYFHASGHLLERLQELASVWTMSTAAGSAVKASHAPILAPVAFMGLGLIGILFTSDFAGEPQIESVVN